MSLTNACEVYKIGNNYYSGREDRNGGNYETNVIVNHIEKCAGNVGFERDIDVAFVINGLKNENDREAFREIRLNYKKVVFILTDAGFVEDNAEFIDQCDLMLHQSPLCFGNDSYCSIRGVKGKYSYIPELFYDETIPVSDIKKNLILFGGNIKGREDDIKDFVFTKEGELRTFVFMLYKDEHGNDFRVNYENYRRFMSLFKFAYVSGRKAGSDIGWVTPRFVETINAGCYPILIGGYDKYCHFGFTNHESYNEALITIASMSDEHMKSEIEFAKIRIKENMKKADERFERILRGELR